MAKINSSTLVITASKLVKNDESDNTVLIDKVTAEQISAILLELLGTDVMIEIEIP